MFLQALIREVEAARIAKFGKTLFGSLYPSTAPDECVLIRSSGGPAPSKYLPVQEHAIQFLSRAVDYPTAEANVWKIFRLFHGRVDAGAWTSKHNYTVGSIETGTFYILKSEALQLPTDISPDEAGRAEVSLNILFRVRLSA
jgi:hypothetical protein